MNGNTIVIYASSTGFSKRYAEWIYEETACVCVPYEQRRTINFSQYDTVVFGGWLHAGSIKGLKWFKTILSQLNGKKVAVYVTGAMPFSQESVNDMTEHNFTVEERNALGVFYVQGGICYEKMGTIDRMMMSMFCKMLKKQEGESERYRAISRSFDASSREQLASLLEYIKK